MAFQPIIYTFGASEYLNSIMESMSILFDFSKNNQLVSLYRLAGVLGVLMMALTPFASRGSDGSPGALDWAWFIRFALLLTVIIVPKTDVRIEDLTLKKTYVVTNAPWALSIFGWMTSSIGYGLTELYENSLGGGMNPVESYSGNGIAFGSRYYNILPKVAIFDTQTMDNQFRPFVSECLLPAVGPINAKISGITLNQLNTSANYKNSLEQMNALWLKNRFVDTPIGILTCLDLRNNIVSSLDKDSIAIQTRLGISDVLDFDNAYIKQVTDASATSLKQAMFINAYVDSTAAYNVQYDNAAGADSIYQAKAAYTLETSARQNSQFASASMVWLHIVVEGMIYAIWPLLTFLILLPSGWKILSEYIRVLFWIQIWPIFYAILNSIIAVYATNQSSALAMQYGGFTMKAYFQIADLNAGIVTAAGYMSSMVPFIAWMLIQRSSGVMDAVRGFVSQGQSLANDAAKDETSGSLTLNKVTVKDSNTAGNEVTGMMTSKNISSTGTTTTVGGNTTIQSSAMDNKITTSVDYNQVAQRQLSNMTQEIRGQAGSQAKQWNDLKNSLHNAQMSNSGSSSTSSGSGGKDSSVLATGEALLAELAASAQLMSSAKFGLEVAGTGGGTEFKGGFSGSLQTKASTDYKQALDKWNDFSKQNQAVLQGTIGDSFNQSQGLAQSSSKTITAAENVVTAETKLQSMGSTIKSSGDNDFVQYLMNEQGLSAAKINDMQWNNSGQLNKLAQDYAENVFVPKIIGDTSNYGVKGLDHSAITKDINQNANAHANGGATNQLENKTQAFIDQQNTAANQNSNITTKHDNEVSNFHNKPSATMGNNMVKVGRNAAYMATADTAGQLVKSVKSSASKVKKSTMNRGTSAAKRTQKGGSIAKNGYPTYNK